VVEVVKETGSPEGNAVSAARSGLGAGQSASCALDRVRKRVNWVLDGDCRDFFTRLDHRWLEKMLEHRIADSP
jgi:retron-type reverse transcriptase